MADKLAAETAAHRHVRCELEAAGREAAALRRRVEQVEQPRAVESFISAHLNVRRVPKDIHGRSCG
jgi:hypothetical protein